MVAFGFASEFSSASGAIKFSASSLMSSPRESYMEFITLFDLSDEVNSGLLLVEGLTGYGLNND